MNKLSVAERAYIAGFLDADGSVYIRLKPNKTYRYCYQVAPNIVFFQAIKERAGLEKLQKILGVGYIRERNDGILEFTIGDMPSMIELLKSVQPYLLLKNQQAKLMLKVLSAKRSVNSARQFLELCQLVDQFQSLNYSKKRKQMAPAVKKALLQEELLTP